MILYWSFFLICGYWGVNFLATIFLVASSAETGLAFLYTWLNAIIFIPAAFFVFYRGYVAIWKRPKDNRSILWYRILQAILVGLYILFSFLPIGGFHGWVKIY